MMDICAYVLQMIGGDLSSIDAHGYHQVKSKTGTACIFLAKGRKVAIPWSIQDGVTCYLTDEIDVDDESYPNWTPLWSTNVVGHPDDLGAYLDQFPQDDNDMLRFIGEKLRGHLS